MPLMISNNSSPLCVSGIAERYIGRFKLGVRYTNLPLDEHGHDYVNIVVHAYRADGSRARGGGEL
jgi:hypothetical protein